MDYNANSFFMTTADFYKEDNETTNTLRCPACSQNIHLCPVLMCSFSLQLASTKVHVVRPVTSAWELLQIGLLLKEWKSKSGPDYAQAIKCHPGPGIGKVE